MMIYDAKTMAKLFNEKIIVHLNEHKKLDAFIWRKRVYKVKEVLSWWREPSAWWDGKPIRLFARIVARNSHEGIYEVYRAGNDWFLDRLLD
jgi:hypothetical protein